MQLAQSFRQHPDSITQQQSHNYDPRCSRQPAEPLQPLLLSVPPSLLCSNSQRSLPAPPASNTPQPGALRCPSRTFNTNLFSDNSSTDHSQYPFNDLFLICTQQESSDDAEEESSSEDAEESSEDAEEEEEEEDEDEPEDPAPAIYEECEKSKACAPLKHHFDECTKRVEEGKGFEGENCIEEFCKSFDTFGCFGERKRGNTILISFCFLRGGSSL